MSKKNNNEKSLNPKLKIPALILNIGLSFFTIFFVLMSLNSIQAEEVRQELRFNNIHVFITILSISLHNFFLIFKSEEKTEKVKFIIGSSIYLLSAVSALLFDQIPIFGLLSFVLFMSSTLAKCIVNITKKESKLSIIRNVIISVVILIVIMAVTTSVPEELFSVLIMLELFMALFIAVLHLILTAFSKNTATTLLKILHTTHAIEIICGLLTIMIAFSLLFPLFEDGISNFLDGLWYCFAVVTTIGFGDFYATSIVGRILTVILGIYGIVVVAILTSIIVNFYNEVSKEKKDN